MKFLQILLSIIFLCTLQRSRNFFVKANDDYFFPENSLTYNGYILRDCRYNLSRKAVYCEYYFTKKADGGRVKMHKRIKFPQSEVVSDCQFDKYKLRMNSIRLEFIDKNGQSKSNSVCQLKSDSQCVLPAGKTKANFIMKFTGDRSCTTKFYYNYGSTSLVSYEYY